MPQLCSLKGRILSVWCVWHNYLSQSSQKWLSCLTITFPKAQRISILGCVSGCLGVIPGSGAASCVPPGQSPVSITQYTCHSTCAHAFTYSLIQYIFIKHLPYSWHSARYWEYREGIRRSCRPYYSPPWGWRRETEAPGMTMLLRYVPVL